MKKVSNAFHYSPDAAAFGRESDQERWTLFSARFYCGSEVEWELETLASILATLTT